MTFKEIMFLGYLQYLFEEKAGDERDEAATKAVLDFLLDKDFQKCSS